MALGRLITPQDVGLPLVKNFLALKRKMNRITTGLPGGSRVVIGFAGDSLTAGQGGGPNAEDYEGSKPYSHPVQSARLMPASYKATVDNFFGNQRWGSASPTTAITTQYDAKMTFAGSGWSWRDDQKSIGAALLQNSSTTDTFTYTPEKAFNAVDILLVRASTHGTLTVNFGGATLATYNSQNASTDVQKITVTSGGTAALGTINIQRNGTGGRIWIIGLIAYDTANPAVHFCNMGWAGARASDWEVSSSPYAPALAMAALQPDAIVYFIGSNGMDTIPAATYKASVRAFMVSNPNSAFILGIEPPQAASRDPLGVTAAYDAAMYELALERGAGLIDLRTRYGSWSLIQAAGMNQDATVHLKAEMYRDWAQANVNLLIG